MQATKKLSENNSAVFGISKSVSLRSLLKNLQDENLISPLLLTGISQEEFSKRIAITYVNKTIHIGDIEPGYDTPHWLLRASSGRSIDIDTLGDLLDLQVKKVEFLSPTKKKENLTSQIHNLRVEIAEFLEINIDTIDSGNLRNFIRVMSLLGIGFRSGVWGRDNIHDFLKPNTDYAHERKALLEVTVNEVPDNISRLVPLLVNGIPYEIAKEFWELPDSWIKEFCSDMPQLQIYEFGSELMRTLMVSHKNTIGLK